MGVRKTQMAQYTVPDLLSGDRGSGKTNTLALWVKADPENRIMITVSEFVAEDIRQMYGLSKRNVVTYNTATQGGLRGRERNILYAIDEPSMILAHLLSLDGPITVMADTVDVIDDFKPRPAIKLWNGDLVDLEK